MKKKKKKNATLKNINMFKTFKNNKKHIEKKMQTTLKNINMFKTFKNK